MPPRGQNSFIFMQFSANIFKTSMHSRRMRTDCAFVVCRGGGCLTIVPGGVCLWSWGVCFWSGRGGQWGALAFGPRGGLPMVPGGSALGPGGVSAYGPMGGSAYGPRGSAFGPGGYPSMQWGRPPLWTESQTRVKT